MLHNTVVVSQQNSHIWWAAAKLMTGNYDRREDDPGFRVSVSGDEACWDEGPGSSLPLQTLDLAASLVKSLENMVSLNLVQCQECVCRIEIDIAALRTMVAPGFRWPSHRSRE